MKAKILCLILVLCLCLSVLAGCSSEKAEAPVESEAAAETPVEEAPAPEEEPAPEDEAEPVPEEIVVKNGNPNEVEEIPVELPITTNGESFSVWMGMSPAALGYINDYSEENLVWNELEKRTGVNIEFDLYHPDQTSTLWSLMQAGGEYADVLAGQLTYTGGNDQAVEDGVYVELTELAQQYAPNYWAKLTCNDELYDAVTTDNGNLVHLATFYNSYRGPDQGLVIRGDWLDKLGMEVPKTVDQLHDALAGFKNELGAEAAMWIPTSCYYQEGSILSAFGGAFNNSGLYNDNGEIKMCAVQDNFKEYLQLLNAWYEEGIIWKDFPTYGAQQMFRDTSMIAAGDTGFFRSEVSEMATFARITEDPDAYFVAVPDPVMNEGDVLHIDRSNPGYLKAANWIITTSCEYPEIVLQFCDYCYTDEGSQLCNYGLESETFEYDENGNPQLTDVVMNNEVYDYRVAILMYVVDVGPYVLDAARGTNDYTEDMLNASDIWISTPTDEAYAIPAKAVLTADEQTEQTNIFSDINTYLSENLVKFVTGDLSFDEWDSYVATIESMNMARCIELSQIALDRYLEAQ